MKYKNFLIRLFDLILVLGLLAGYQAVIYSRDKEATIAELKSQVNQLQGEKEDILEAAKNSGKLGADGASAGQAETYKDGTLYWKFAGIWRRNQSKSNGIREEDQCDRHYRSKWRR